MKQLYIEVKKTIEETIERLYACYLPEKKTMGYRGNEIQDWPLVSPNEIPQFSISDISIQS